MDVDALFPFSAALPQIFRSLWARCGTTQSLTSLSLASVAFGGVSPVASGAACSEPIQSRRATSVLQENAAMTGGERGRAEARSTATLGD